MPDAGSAFKYIQDVLEEPPRPPDRAAAFKAAVLASVPALAELGSLETARLVLQHLPTEHPQVVQNLEPTPQLQFRYLQAATQVKPQHSPVLAPAPVVCIAPSAG